MDQITQNFSNNIRRIDFCFMVFAFASPVPPLVLVFADVAQFFRTLYLMGDFYWH